MKISPNFFVISDLHLWHGKITEFENRPPNHQSLIVKRWNKVVGAEDSVLCLGDLTFGSKEQTKSITSKLNGKKFLIRGNHDGKSDTWYRDVFFEPTNCVYKSFKNKYDVKIKTLLTHVPVVPLPEGWLNIHGHVHSEERRDEFALSNGHYNICCEPLDFTPIKIKVILDDFYKKALDRGAHWG